MKNSFYSLFRFKKVILASIFSLFLIILVSCSKDDNDVDELKTDPHRREGVINLYSNGNKIVFPEIVEYPFVKISEKGWGYDTIGFAYTGYINKLHSIIGAISITILNDSLKLSSVQYHYPSGDNYAESYARSDRDFDLADVFHSKIVEQDDSVRGFFKGDLYMGGPYFGKDPFVVDSCIFVISK